MWFIQSLHIAWMVDTGLVGPTSSWVFSGGVPKRGALFWGLASTTWVVTTLSPPIQYGYLSPPGPT